ncbi:MAG: type II secretion system F family protein [Hyphomicrobium sp.]|jgi:tight adherence protein C|uniref:type II secretion system F family protein n=1 Tax=Hyphomicrobium sp. TaxID=82 RepID=UPI0025BF1AA7|nr:type II secretion system F family protein [Hyphomicrobium sp.]MBX9864452.1 type II secretion system F family protein [Hyphomicrobium sp.]
MQDLVNTIMSPQFLATLLAAVAAFATILTLVMPMLARDQMNQRMRIMATERDKLRSQRLTDLSKDRSGQAKLRQTPKGFMQNIVDKLNLRKQFDNEELRNKLKMAGLRGQGPLVAFMFFRVAAPPLSFVVALVYFFLIAHIDQSNSMKLLYATAAGGAGYYFPNVFIENLAQKRQQAIKVAFPEALDMLLICVQSGMSVESAFGKVAKEVANQSIELSEELALTTAELSYLPERRQAFENLAKRTALPTVKAVTTALIQADRYGTPVGQALRVMAKENRDMRMADAEKKAAALPPKLTVPMIVFFLPVLFLVILGPAAINYFKMQ